MAKYRIKTKTEFIKEFGEDWRRHVSFNMDGVMDYICVDEIPDSCVPLWSCYKLYKGWAITEKMVIRDKYISKFLERTKQIFHV